MTYISPPPTMPTLLSIGDIHVGEELVITPRGNVPLASARFSARDHSFTDRVIPTWAIVCAIIGSVFCLLGLLFLLVKQERTAGYVQVQVIAAGLVHVVDLPVHSPGQAAELLARVARANQLVACLG